jgi:hypothetical protein
MYVLYFGVKKENGEERRETIERFGEGGAIAL